MANQFGERLRQLREEKNLLQRQVASGLEIDTPMVSKIERGERRAKKEQVSQFASFYEADKAKLLTLWLADQVFDVIQGEDMAEEVLKTVSSKINSNEGK